MSLMGLHHPLPIRDLSDFIEGKRAHEAELGDRAVLYVPFGLAEDGPGGLSSSSVRAVEVYRGYTTQELLDASSRQDGQSHLDDFILIWEATHAQPLARVARMQDRIARETGCEQHDALAFLLCDRLPMLPWIRVSSTITRGQSEYRPVRIDLGGPEVPPSAVAAVYEEVRRDLLDSGVISPRSPSTPWPEALEAFVLDYRHKHARDRGPRLPGGEWAAIFDAFKAEYPEQPYSSSKSMKNVYSRRQRRAGGRQ